MDLEVQCRGRILKNIDIISPQGLFYLKENEQVYVERRVLDDYIIEVNRFNLNDRGGTTNYTLTIKCDLIQLLQEYEITCEEEYKVMRRYKYKIFAIDTDEAKDKIDNGEYESIEHIEDTFGELNDRLILKIKNIQNGTN